MELSPTAELRGDRPPSPSPRSAAVCAPLRPAAPPFIDGAMQMSPRRSQWEAAGRGRTPPRPGGSGPPPPPPRPPPRRSPERGGSGGERERGPLFSVTLRALGVFWGFFFRLYSSPLLLVLSFFFSFFLGVFYFFLYFFLYVFFFFFLYFNFLIFFFCILFWFFFVF